MWGQCDSIYTSFLLATLYFLLSGRKVWAVIAFGLALSFKLQAMFLAPFLLWMVARKVIELRYLLLIPVVWFVCLIPAWIIGRPIDDLMTAYLEQSRTYDTLSANAPNMYQWIPDNLYDYYAVGIAFAAAVVLVIFWALRRSQMKISNDLVVFLGFYSVLIMPYILPKMHDRYFFPADVISIVLAFYYPRYCAVPMVIGCISLVTYMKYLFGLQFILPLSWWAAVPLGLIAILGWKLWSIFYLPRAAGRMGAAAPDEHETLVAHSRARRRRRAMRLALACAAGLAIGLAAGAALSRYVAPTGSSPTAISGSPGGGREVPEAALREILPRRRIRHAARLSSHRPG